jgi:hypothetical protein
MRGVAVSKVAAREEMYLIYQPIIAASLGSRQAAGEPVSKRTPFLRQSY